MKITRALGRRFDELRPFSINYGIFEYAAGSALITLGKTKVLCAVSLEQGVPSFLRGKGTGWLSAEYAMLPAATLTRTARESTMGSRNGRSVEISRLIGRVLRTIVNLEALGERTIFVDCDVLQADAGTRSASITGACAALRMAQTSWLTQRIIKEPILTDQLASVSVGLKQQPLLDPDYQEDSTGNGDFNFVMTRRGLLIEVQGGAEKKPIEQEMFDQISQLAKKGINEIFSQLDEKTTAAPVEKSVPNKAPLFSLMNRLSQTT